MAIWLVRHGETEWSASGRHTGVTDVQLGAEGEAQAREIGALLRSHPFDHVLSSPMTRSRRTAQLAGFPEPELDEDLREVDYGSYEGLTTPEIQRSRPGWELFRDGCPDGETPIRIRRRADRLLARLRALEGDALVFGHGHTLRALGARYLGLSVRVATNLALDAGAISILAEGRDGPWLLLWNRTPDLPPD